MTEEERAYPVAGDMLNHYRVVERLASGLDCLIRAGVLAVLPSLGLTLLFVLVLPAFFEDNKWYSVVNVIFPLAVLAAIGCALAALPLGLVGLWRVTSADPDEREDKVQIVRRRRTRLAGVMTVLLGLASMYRFVVP